MTVLSEEEAFKDSVPTAPLNAFIEKDIGGFRWRIYGDNGVPHSAGARVWPLQSEAEEDYQSFALMVEADERYDW